MIFFSGPLAAVEDELTAAEEELTTKIGKDEGDWPVSVGVSLGYLYTKYSQVTDGPIVRSLPGQPPLPGADLHTFHAGISAEIEVLSWFSLQTQLQLTESGVVVEPTPFAPPEFSRYLYLSSVFHLSFLWQVSSFKLSFSLGFGPNFHLSRPDLFGVSRVPAKSVQVVLQQLVRVEYKISPYYSLFLSGGWSFTGGPYGDGLSLRNFFVSFPFFFGANRLFYF